MSFTNVHGGPCPVCGGTGELLAHAGTYGGQRIIVHRGQAGQIHVCEIPESDGVMQTKGGLWSYAREKA